MNLLRRKSVTDLQTEALTDHSLKRALGALNLTMLGIGAIIGTGIFVLTGTVAAQNAGPAVVLAFVLAGIASIFAALCYSEFASLVPMAGSAYTYGYATLGELIAWIIGWDLILEYALGAVTVAIGWSGYVVSFLKDVGVNVPCSIAAARGVVAPQCTEPAVFNLPAVIIIAIVTTLLVIGIRESANVNNVILVMLLGQSRVFYSMARDGLMPQFVNKVHPKFQTPYITSIVTGIAVAIVASLLTVREAGNLVSIGTLLAFVIVSIGVVVLRVREPNLPRAFKTPAVFIVAPLGALSAAYLMVSLPWTTWRRLIIWFVFGMVLYFAYGMRHSKLASKS